MLSPIHRSLGVAGVVVALLVGLVALATGGTAGAGAVGATASRSSAGAPGAAGPADDRDRVVLTTPTTAPPESLLGFYGRPVHWESCSEPSGSDCGEVTVPVDYADPSGETLRIALLKIPAGQPDRRKGTLFINPGGPGASGIEFARRSALTFSREVRDSWDVVGFDPRGVGASGGFECMRDRDLDAMFGEDPTPDGPAEKAALEQARRSRMAGCLERGGPVARSMGSEQVARDLDILRDAVGDAHLNYYGVSYGTLIGALYAKNFTDRIGYMVLDSGFDPDRYAGPTSQEEIDGEVDAEARDLEADIAGVLDTCVQSGDCPLGDSRRRAQSALISFLDGLDAKPLPSDAQGIPLLTEGWAATALLSAGTYPDASQDLVEALRVAIEDGDGTDLVRQAMDAVERNDDGTYDDFARLHLPVHCADWGPDPLEEASVSASVLEAHPLWAHLVANVPEGCAGWSGTERAVEHPDVAAATPIVVIGDTDDVVTPFEGTAQLAGVIDDARLVTVEAEDHGAYGMENVCADAAVDDYLVHGLAPDDGTWCPAP